MVDEQNKSFRLQKIYEFQLRFANQIKAEFQRTALTGYKTITNIRPICDNLIIFQADGVGFTATITPKTGKIKRNSIRIERY